MPKNHFPDSIEKRELRRRDYRLLQKFVGITRNKLDYCGMPSVEFLDVECWKDLIKNVVAIEYDKSVLKEIQIERDKRGYEFPVVIHQADVLDFLQLETTGTADLYNLDFYGGFLYLKKTGGSKSIEAFRQLFVRQGNLRRPFVLITTFNVREAGATEYLRFLEDVERELQQNDNSHENLNAHKTAHADMIQLCFPVFCLTQAQANGLTQVYQEAFLYQSSAQMLHFHQWFTTAEGALPGIVSRKAFIDIANRPLREMVGQIPQVRRRYPQIPVPT